MYKRQVFGRGDRRGCGDAHFGHGQCCLPGHGNISGYCHRCLPAFELGVRAAVLILVMGGAASGKSEYAESVVVASSIHERYYIATMMPYDDECFRRIERHRAMRAQKGFILSLIHI